MRKVFFFVLMPLFCFTLCFLNARDCSAQLKPGITYYVYVDAIGGNGQTVPLGISTTSRADADGKLFFVFQDLPTRSSYNFLVVTIKDGSFAVVRQSIVPAPETGSTTYLGASPMTYAQTKALLNAMQTAGSDDPVMALFGFILVRSGGYTNSHITHLANMGRLGIIGGFNPYLSGQIGAAKMALFKAAIVDGMANYTSRLKDAVDTINTGGTGKDERAQAAAMLSQVLIDAATEADFNIDLITAAMKAASDKIEVYLAEEVPAEDEDAVSAMDVVMATTYMKLRADRLKKKYTNAFASIGSEDYAGKMNEAIDTMADTLTELFEIFETAYEDEDALPGSDDVRQAYDDVNDLFGLAFRTFMSDVAASDAEIEAMIETMEDAFALDLSGMDRGMFKFRDPEGNQLNWPITMVASITWVINNHKDDFTYTRDDTEVPNIMSWMVDDGAGGRVRRDYDDNDNNGIPGDEQNMPAVLAAIFALREDVEIIDFRKQAEEIAASWDITPDDWAHVQANDPEIYNEVNDLNNDVYGGARLLVAADADTNNDDNFATDQPDFRRADDLYPFFKSVEQEAITARYNGRLDTIKDNIGGVDDDAHKQALIDLALPPNI